MPHLITKNLPFTVRFGWTAHDFKWLFREGFLDPEAQLELIEGDIWVKPFQDFAVINSMALCADKLKKLLGGNITVRVQQPLLLGGLSQPEPEIAVVVGTSIARLYAHYSALPAEEVCVTAVFNSPLICALFSL